MGHFLMQMIQEKTNSLYICANTVKLHSTGANNVAHLKEECGFAADRTAMLDVLTCLRGRGASV